MLSVVSCLGDSGLMSNHNKTFIEIAVPLVIGPRFGNVLGGTAVHLIGPCFNEMDLIVCSFEDEKEDAFIVNNRTAICVSPRFTDIGWKSLTLTILRDGKDVYFGQSQFYASMLKLKIIIMQCLTAYVKL